MKKSRPVVGIAVLVSSFILVVASVISYRAVAQLANSGNEILWVVRRDAMSERAARNAMVEADRRKYEFIAILAAVSSS